MLYLDHAATTPLRPEARAAMAPLLGDQFGNPSGVHATARQAKNAIEEAREGIAQAIGATRPLEIVFTGGGTEADNLAVLGSSWPERGGIVATAVEHAAVLESARFAEKNGQPVSVVEVDRLGRVSPLDVAAAVDERTAVVSVMMANNETGVVQPVAEIAELVRSLGSRAVIHTDAVQAFASLSVVAGPASPDLISVSAHKIGGPQGVGFLYVRDGVQLEPVVHGGGQELGRRSGTHNVAAIVGLGAAVAATVADRDGYRERVGAARDRFESELRSMVEIEVTSGDAERLASHSHLRFPGVAAETLLVRLDLAGVAAAAGAACHSGAIETSHVLDAMGIAPGVAAESIRFSFGRDDDASSGAAAARIVGDVVRGLS